MSWESPSRNPPEPKNEGEKGHGSCVANPSLEGGLASSNLSPVAEVEVELHSGNDGSMSNPNSSKADRRPPTDADFPKVERRTKMRLDRSVSLKPPLPPNEKVVASSSKSNLSSPVEILRDKPPFEIPVPRPRNPLREDDTFTTRIHYNGVMETLEGGVKRYVNGECDYIHKCDMDKWSKLEVDDALEKRGVDVSGLEYFYLWPRMSLW
ncbi:hypothetical protein SASPL_111535 [Salvia splendens]|uniref:PB1-like domain-containing protein n=1 Tax=Salvia splendens TaxID=180675 RepID=A0A8X8YCP9_SALSN|nr:hypothetical protein SASPL_111535 [Salvia splendens]